MALVTAMATSASTTQEICGTTFTVDTLEHYKAGPGMTYTLLRYTNSDGTRVLKSHVLTAETQAEGAPTIRAGLSHDVISGTERVSAIAKRKSSDTRQYLAGINSDFFVTSSFANSLKAAGFPNMLGNPNSNCAVESQIVAGNAPITDGAHQYGHFVVGEKPTDLWCDVTTVSNSLAIRGVVSSMPSLQPWVNVVPRDADVVVFNSAMGTSTNNPAGVTEIQAVLTDGQTWGINKLLRFKVTSEPSTNGNMAIPANGMVIAAGAGVSDKVKQTFAKFTPGTEFTYNTTVRLTDYKVNPKVTSMACGDVVLLYRGEVREAGLATDRYINVRTTKYPHTMAGYSEDRSKVVFCVVDGSTRSPKAGCTYPEGAEMMRSYGCYDAVNFDGGGSSTMYLQMPGVVNTPCDGAERAVCSGLYMTIDAPADEEIAEIRFKDWAVKLNEGDEYTPVIYGYNRYGRLVDTNVQGVTLNCPADLGSIRGGTLSATGSGTHALTATYGGHEATVAVTVGNGASVETIVSDADRLEINILNGTIIAKVPGNQAATWALYNAAGTLMASGTTQDGLPMRIDASTLPSGLYVATVATAGRIFAAKAAL